MMKTAALTFAVLTGCNSGIGYAWASIMIKEGYDVYATDVTIGDNLKSLEQAGAKIQQLDVTSIESISLFKKYLGDQPLDILLNIAGIMPDKTYDTLKDITLDTLHRTFAINSYGPLLLTQALMPNILAAPAPRRVGVVSSRVGSIADNSSGGYMAYRASKTAVNSFFKTIAVDTKDSDIVITMLHPGFTRTNLDPDIEKMPGVVEPGEAASKLWQIVQGKGIEDTGKFWHREGQELPW